MTSREPTAIVIGLALGVPIGLAFDTIGMGIEIGLAFAIALGALPRSRSRSGP